MADIETILSTELELIIEDIREGIDANRISATGNLKRNIRSEIKTTGPITRGLIVAPAYLFTIDTGRKPTVNNGPGDLFPAIKRWLLAKNIPLWEGFADLDAQAHAITNKIHREGTERFRNLAARNRIIPDAIPPGRVQKITQQIATETAGEVVKAIRQVTQRGIKI